MINRYKVACRTLVCKDLLEAIWPEAKTFAAQSIGAMALIALAVHNFAGLVALAAVVALAAAVCAAVKVLILGCERRMNALGFSEVELESALLAEKI